MQDETAEVFNRIFRERVWPSDESVSGAGSDLSRTTQIIRELPHFLRRFGVRSMLDIPCGDFNWMRHVDLDGIDYTGADIVPDLVQANNDRYGGPGRRFALLNLLKDDLPDRDLILCRDCLFHFSHADVFKAFETMAKTSCRYVLTTTFTYQSYPRNAAIETGQWTAINLEMAPFSLEPPLAMLVEGSTESIVYSPEFAVQMHDRCLALWDITSIRKRLARMQG